MKKALVIVDVQSYFLRESPQTLPSQIATHIEASEYDWVVCTIFKGVKDSNYTRTLGWESCMNQEDCELALELQPYVTNENVFTKTSYSAFHDGRLHTALQEKGIEVVDLCGIDLDACVLATAYEAFDFGYDIKVLFELCHTRFSQRTVIEEIIERNIQSKNDSR